MFGNQAERNPPSRWLSFSELVIQEMSAKILFGITFYELYKFGMHKRAEIAHELRQDVLPDGTITDEYAKFRTNEKRIIEVFSAADMRESSGAVLRLLKDLIENKRTLFTTRSCVEHDGGGNYHLQIHSHGQWFTYIRINPHFTKAEIFYSYILKKDFDNAMKVAANYLHICFPTTKKDDLLESIGRLSHLMAHLLLTKQGNFDIMCWIQHAIALSKGFGLYDLGKYSNRTCKASEPDCANDTVIRWDYMALITPKREQYARWFAQYALI